MTDQLSLSIWLDSYGRGRRLAQFEKVLRTFPFSQRAQPQSVVSVLAIDVTEPPLFERPVNGPLDPGDVIETLRDYSGDDLAYSVESWWDLWQLDDDWGLRPARILISCFGPTFDNGSTRDLVSQEDLRIDFGIDSHYLPPFGVPGAAKMVESNIRSLLRLVHELESALPVQKRTLETESGENFADRLQQVLAAAGPVQ